MHLQDDTCHIRLHLHGSTFVCIVAKILGNAITSGEEQSIVILRLELLDRQNLASGDTGSFHQNVALLVFHQLFGKMIHHFRLQTIRCKTLIFTTMLFDG